ncbi:hypothetical protein NODU109028_17740 [Nocardioides dubius]|uniref:Tissue inhibitor of metalloproteinase n=1 Tax=Nocardioides dubius TaxID=317019 RepID=A0ABP4EPJ2_9ACTN
MGRVIAGLLLATLSALVVPIGIGAAPAHACSCAMATLGDQAARSDYAFVGSVVEGSVKGQADRGMEPITFTVAVDEIYAGEVGATVQMQTQASSASCGLGQVPQGRMIWFSYLNEGAATDRRLNVGLCTPPVAADAANLAEVEKALGAAHPVDDDATGTTDVGGGEATAPKADADDPEDEDQALWWPIAVGVVVVLGAAGGLIWVRSGRRRG